MDSLTQVPRLIRPLSPPLGCYFRVGRDYRSFSDLIAQERAGFSGLVFDARDLKRQGELLDSANEVCETVLDTRAMELATPVASQDQRTASLPWAVGRLPHTPDQLSRGDGLQMVELIADAVVEGKFSGVLAPAHFNTDIGSWLDVDVELARALRAALDRGGKEDVTIYFPLALHSKIFRSAPARQRILSKLERAPIDALWLRIHPFSASTAGPKAIRDYLDAARDLQRLGLPVIGEHTGTAGVALLAFGAIGGIESGVTMGERFDVAPLMKASNPGKGFIPPPRIYLAPIGAFVKRERAAELFSHQGMKPALACRDTSCCRRGVADMDKDPRRHFLIQRQREVTEISSRPEPVRPGVYLEEFLRPATDLALRATKVHPKLARTQEKLERWRLALGAAYKQAPPQRFGIAPQGHRLEPQLRKGA